MDDGDCLVAEVLAQVERERDAATVRCRSLQEQILELLDRQDRRDRQ